MKIKKKKYNIGNSTKSAVVYTLATLFSRGLAIITVPIFTRIMTTSQIGTVNLYNSWYSLISAFATLSLTSGGYVVALTEYQDKRDEYQSSVLTLTSVVAIFIAAIFFVAPSFWSQIIGLPVELCILMLLGFLFAPAQDFG
ncbi:MAG: lipopolysaccharide biosynthesis protein [Clostridia bacterium]